MGFFKKGILKSAISLFVAGFLASQSYAATEDAKYASLVIDADTGSVLHQENAGKLRYPASLTKMMTLYLAFQAMEQGTLTMNKQLKVSSFAANQKPSIIGVRAGQTIALEDAINAVIIKSANDASVVIAEAISGSEAQFAQKMTSTAKSLGMKNTVFANASGLPNNKQVTTAYDLARLAVALKRDYPQYYPLFSRSSFTYKGRTIYSHNRVTKNYRGADGLKTGYIRASGFNLVTTASRSGKSLVGVVMGGRSIKSRDTNMMKLLDQAFYSLSTGRAVSSGNIDNGEAPKRNVSYKKQEKTEQNNAVNDITEPASKNKRESAYNQKSSDKPVRSTEEVASAEENPFANQKGGIVSYEQTSSSIDIETTDNLKPKRVKVNGKKVPLPTFKPSAQEMGLVKIDQEGVRG